MTVKPSRFTGQNFEAFQIEFDSICDANEWDDNQRLRYLKASMKENAVFILSQKPRDDWTYSSLMQALKQKYSCPQNPFTLRSTLHNMTQGSRNFPEFMDEIMRAVSRGGITDLEKQTDLAVETFVMGVADPKIKEELITRNPKTTQSALQIAIDKESVCKAAYGDQKTCSVMFNQPEVLSQSTDEIKFNSNDLAALKKQLDEIRVVQKTCEDLYKHLQNSETSQKMDTTTQPTENKNSNSNEQSSGEKRKFPSKKNWKKFKRNKFGKNLSSDIEQPQDSFVPYPNYLNYSQPNCYNMQPNAQQFAPVLQPPSNFQPRDNFQPSGYTQSRGPSNFNSQRPSFQPRQGHSQNYYPGANKKL